MKMKRLGDKVSEYRERRLQLYIELHQMDGNASVQRFEHVLRLIHVLTYKIKSFKNSIHYEEE